MRCFIWIALLLIYFCCGCSTFNKDKEQEQNLKICLGLDVRSLDPRCSHEHPSNYVVKMLFEGLFRIDLNGEVKPALVESYEISSDKKTYTFHLKPSKWSNGTEVTAFDFLYAWRQVIDPKLSNNGVHNFYPIKNVQAVLLGNANLDDIGVKAIDEKTLIVELEHPAPFFLETLTFSSFCPVSLEQELKCNNWSENAGPEFICNGPFKLKEWKKGYEIIVEKNPLFWDAKAVRLNQIKIGIVVDLNTQLALFEKKQVDWVGKPLGKLPLDAIPALKKMNQLNYFSSSGLYWYFFNTEKFPFNNKKIRQAFAYAINRREITQHLLQENEIPATSLIPSLVWEQKKHFEDGNTLLAKKLFLEGLNEINVTAGDLEPITLSYASSELNAKVAQAIQNQWERAFGIRVQLQHQEWKSYYDQLVKGSYQIGGMGWFSWIRDPSYTLETFKYTSDGINMSRWENAQYQAFLNAAQIEIDDEKRMDFFRRAEELILEEMPVVPVYFINITFAKNEKLRNFYISELNEIDFTWAYFE